jgi:hypothetical protein
VQPLSSTTTPAAFQLANPFASIPPPSIIASAFIPSATFFAGLRDTYRASGNQSEPCDSRSDLR